MSSSEAFTFFVLEERAVGEADERAGHAGEAAHAVLLHQQARHSPSQGQHRAPTDLGTGHLLIHQRGQSFRTDDTSKVLGGQMQDRQWEASLF
jgi:hypothetical protein